MAVYDLQLPLTDEAVRMLRAGDQVTLTGDIYTGRDAAHKRLIALLEKGDIAIENGKFTLLFPPLQSGVTSITMIPSPETQANNQTR